MYTLVRSAKRKTLALCVKQDLTVKVRAPSRTPQAEIDRFVRENQGWIAKQLARQQARNDAACTVTPEEEAALRQQAKELLPQRVAYFSQRMGLTPAGFRVTGARTRLGSCSGANSLCFSFRLMAYPPEAIDYVVVHELAHIRHKNHSPQFYQLIARYLPDYRERLAILKDPRYRIL